MTMTSSHPEPTYNPKDHKLAVIEQTYPGWRIRRSRHEMWTAVRITPPTPTQAAAGLHDCVIQPDLHALSAILCQQLLIAQTTG